MLKRTKGDLHLEAVMSGNNFPISFQIDDKFHEQFKAHFLSSCMRNDFPVTLFSTGLAEECVEFIDVINKILKGATSKEVIEEEPNTINAHSTMLYDEEKGQIMPLHQIDQETYELVLGEAGDVLWYLYGLSFSLPGGKFHNDSLPSSLKDKPKPVSCWCWQNDIKLASSESKMSFQSSMNQQLDELKNQFCSNMGKLCGSIKKFSRGDSSWEVFQNRIQNEISSLVIDLHYILHRLQSYCNQKELNIENAMMYNIQKVKKRTMNGTMLGDGDNR